jgi:hypothetical protein
LIAIRREWPVLDSDEEAIRNLARGLLVRSIRDLVHYRGTKKTKCRKIYDEVYAWMYIEKPAFNDDPLDQLMSFEGICDILGWDPGLLRERVKSMTMADLDGLGRNGHGTGLNR